MIQILKQESDWLGLRLVLCPCSATARGWINGPLLRTGWERVPENYDLGTDTVLELLTLHLSQAPWGCSSGVLVFGDRVTCQRRSESSLSRASLFPQLPKASSPSRKWMHSFCTSPSSPKKMSSSRPCRTSPPGERWPYGEQTPWAWAGKGKFGGSKSLRGEAESAFSLRCTANDLKCIIRLIKHDLKMNSGAKHV